MASHTLADDSVLSTLETSSELLSPFGFSPKHFAVLSAIDRAMPVDDLDAWDELTELCDRLMIDEDSALCGCPRLTPFGQTMFDIAKGHLTRNAR